MMTQSDWRPVTLPELAVLLQVTIKVWPLFQYTRDAEAHGRSIYSGLDTGIVQLPGSLLVGLRIAGTDGAQPLRFIGDMQLDVRQQTANRLEIRRKHTTSPGYVTHTFQQVTSQS